MANMMIEEELKFYLEQHSVARKKIASMIRDRADFG